MTDELTQQLQEQDYRQGGTEGKATESAASRCSLESDGVICGDRAKEMFEVLQ